MLSSLCLHCVFFIVSFTYYLKGFALCRRPPRTRDALIGPWGFVDKELILETAWIEPWMVFLVLVGGQHFDMKITPRGLRRPPGRVREAPRRLPGEIREPRWLLEASRSRLGGLLGASWAVLGASWGRLGALLGRLGAVLGRLGAVLGRPRAILGPSWRSLGPSGGFFRGSKSGSWRCLEIQ